MRMALFTPSRSEGGAQRFAVYALSRAALL